jgi:hypothetical protein
VLLMLWSAPRSRSTAFFRMMAERGDFMMVHEPFSYLAEFGYADVAGERIMFTGIAGKPGTDIGRHPVLSRYLNYHLPFYEKLHARRLVI